MNKYLKLFLQNAIFSGIFVGAIMVALEMKFFKVGGIIYGAIPLGFIYIMFSYYLRSSMKRNEKYNRLINFSKFSLIGGALFLVFMGVYYGILKKTNNFIYSTVALFAIMIVGIVVIVKCVGKD
jgi:uncharacterized membrane protein (GlpM family)